MTDKPKDAPDGKPGVPRPGSATGPQPAPPSLKSALRRARIEDAERSDILAELRGAELARLEMLAEALEPVYAQLPDDVDIFDAGVVAGERPRLFIDMIGFVEMGADKRTYRFVQDTRHGRLVIAETERPEKMVQSVADYIARRMLERERALASDRTVEEAALALTGAGVAPDESPPGAKRQSPEGEKRLFRPASERSDRTISGAQKGRPAMAVDFDQPAARRGYFTWLWNTIEFFALFLGFIVLLIGLAGAIYFAWTMGEGWWVSNFSKAS